MVITAGGGTCHQQPLKSQLSTHSKFLLLFGIGSFLNMVIGGMGNPKWVVTLLQISVEVKKKKTTQGDEEGVGGKECSDLHRGV